MTSWTGWSVKFMNIWGPWQTDMAYIYNTHREWGGPNIIAWLKLRRIKLFSRHYVGIRHDPANPANKPEAILISHNYGLWLAHKGKLYSELPWWRADTNDKITLEFAPCDGLHETLVFFRRRLGDGYYREVETIYEFLNIGGES